MAPELVSVHQLAAAMIALDVYTGANTATEHAEESARWGAKQYQLRLANALLGAAQVEAMLSETLAGGAEDLAAAHRQQLDTAGVGDDPDKLVGFLQWQVLRVSGTLRLVAQDPSTGPIPLAAAHAAEGLHRLLGVIGGGQVPTVENAEHGIAEMEAARACLVTAIGNVDILLDLLAGLRDAHGED